MTPQIPDIPVRPGALRKIIPDSPFLRLGNQLRITREWRRYVAGLPGCDTTKTTERND